MLQPLNSRKSHPEVFCKKVILKNVSKFTGKHHLFFNKVESSPNRNVLDLEPSTFMSFVSS